MQQQRLITQLLVVIVCLAAASQATPAADDKTETHKINLGKAASVEVPSTWLLEHSDEKSVSFIKRRSNWNDCLISFLISAPKALSAKQQGALQRVIRSSVLAPADHELLEPIFGLPDRRTLSLVKAETLRTEKALRLQFRQQRSAPCEQLPGGRSRRALLQTLTDVILIPFENSKYQLIRFDADTASATTECEGQIGKIFESFKWR